MSEAVHHREDYRDAAGGGSCLGARSEGGRDLPRSLGGIGAELRDELLNREVLFTLQSAKATDIDRPNNLSPDGRFPRGATRPVSQFRQLFDILL